MEILARRLTIITLGAAIFAMTFAAAVERSAHSPRRVHVGSSAPCFHPASLNCTVAL